ncbi:MAG TPA: DNA polymerase III subunit gamma/tau [Castellaniella sp.]|uniref:DNA polymerase III subunit gamma/tau n=1 Tax=Castellaniella sp. TaxID=1955812 RepID=UPI002F1869BB
MSYLVLARKWRPRSFDTLIGQDHVVRALTHALSSGRLHHAWLFTGTRGVGKTTLSRILAKSLNCADGVTATPCGHCQACTEIDAGRYVDYIELDAASNRGVDEMTQLLEQAVYAPSVGRYKVYMIDEVHMLTGHAFNAMLKTLEEPPEHVKFILATTDPQKIPVTVLSRCLQFNLKQMTVPAIVEHLQHVLSEESITAEPQALRLIAQSAAGSMRDALSLTDQAISYAAGDLTTAAVGEMLGTLDQHHLVALLRALAVADAPAVVAVADDLATRGLSFQSALADLAVLLSRVAIAQRLGHAQADDPLAAEVQSLAQALAPDEVQLFYTVAVHSRHELSLAPDEYAGFVMACLRMLGLLPADRVPPVLMQPVLPELAAEQAAATPAASGAEAGAHSRSVIAEPAIAIPELPQLQVGRDSAAETETETETETEVAPDPKAVVDAPLLSADPVQARATLSLEPPSNEPAGDWTDSVPDVADDFDTASMAEVDSDDLGHALAGLEAAPAAPAAETPDPARMTASEWPALAANLPLGGAARALAVNSEWLSGDAHAVRLRVAIHSLVESSSQDRLRTVLSEHFGRALRLDVVYGTTGDDTAYAVDQAERGRRQAAAEQAVQDDAVVRSLTEQFAARVVPGSVQPPAV